MKEAPKSFQVLIALLWISAVPLYANNAKSDIEKIGNRRLARRGIISQGIERRLGKAAAARLERSVRLVQDPELNEYVNRVGKKVAVNSDLKAPVTVKIIESPTFNASSLPGGFLYVTTGLLKNLDSEAQLAAALAHEIGHLAARHAASQATRRILMDGIGFLPFGTAYAIATDISQPSVPLALAKFSRGQELEADFLGVQYLYKSGYDPNALVALLEKTRSIEARTSGATSRRHKAYASHPQTQARISKAQNEIRTILPEREYSVGANLEFDSLKNRLLAGTNSLQTLPGQMAADAPNSEGGMAGRATTVSFESDAASENEIELEERKPIDFAPPVLQHNDLHGAGPGR